MGDIRLPKVTEDAIESLSKNESKEEEIHSLRLLALLSFTNLNRIGRLSGVEFRRETATSK